MTEFLRANPQCALVYKEALEERRAEKGRGDRGGVRHPPNARSQYRPEAQLSCLWAPPAFFFNFLLMLQYVFYKL